MHGLADEAELGGDLVAEPGNVEHARPLRRCREQTDEAVLQARSPGSRSSGSLTMSTLSRCGGRPSTPRRPASSRPGVLLRARRRERERGELARGRRRRAGRGRCRRSASRCRPRHTPCRRRRGRRTARRRTTASPGARARAAAAGRASARSRRRHGGRRRPPPRARLQRCGYLVVDAIDLDLRPGLDEQRVVGAAGERGRRTARRAGLTCRCRARRGASDGRGDGCRARGVRAPCASCRRGRACRR